MRFELDPGHARRGVVLNDNICYSRVRDLDGTSLELRLSLCSWDNNSETRLALGRDDAPPQPPRPCIIWVPGGGWRGCDKNLMVLETAYLAEAGYVVASIYYRSSAQGHWPDQLVDVKTAIRFLRAHAEEYHIDPDSIGIMGRSAGGHLSAMAAMNRADAPGQEWAGYSDRVQAACDLFGPVDLPALMEEDCRQFQDPDYRWHTVAETHAGALLGGPEEGMKARAREASPSLQISPTMCPILILHGDRDALVPCAISEDFYRRIVRAGLGDRADLYILKGAGHGTREFFQPAVRELITGFFDRILSIQRSADQ